MAFQPARRRESVVGWAVVFMAPMLTLTRVLPHWRTL